MIRTSASSSKLLQRPNVSCNELKRYRKPCARSSVTHSQTMKLESALPASLRCSMPFNAARVSDTEWLYLGGRYAEILDFLCSPATGRANVKVLISEPGLGKTVLLRAAIDRIKTEAQTAFVFWTLFRAKDF